MKPKLLLIFGVVGCLLAALLAAIWYPLGADSASTSNGMPLYRHTSDRVQAVLPTLLAPGQPSLYDQLEPCDQGTIYTSLPAKCLTRLGLRPVVTPASRVIIATNPNP